jgi:uncharacterized Zn-binding protein involved in type VI secretion
MFNICRLGDNAFHPGEFFKSIEGSPDTFINNLPVVRVGDHFEPHSHPISFASTGSPTVFVNNKNIVRITSLLQCGPEVIEGSPDTFVWD